MYTHIQAAEDVAAPAEAAFPAEPSAPEPMPDVSTVLSYSPQLQLNLQRSNFAGLEGDVAESSNHTNGEAGASMDPDPNVTLEESSSEAAVPAAERSTSDSKAATAPPVPPAANGRLASGNLNSAGGRLDWRLGPPDRLCREADQLEGLGPDPAPGTTEARGIAVTEASAEDRAFFGILGHLYASARVELIRLADALSLQSSFSPTKRDRSGGEEFEQADLANGFASPDRPAREPASSLNWLSPMRLPVSPTQHPAAAALHNGQRDGKPSSAAAPLPPALPPVPVSTQSQQRPESATAQGQARSQSRLRHASSADAISIDAVRWAITHIHAPPPSWRVFTKP